MHRIRAVVLLALAAFLPGCWSFTPARGPAGADAAATDLAPDAWPARDVDVLRPYLEKTPEIVYRYRYAPEVNPTALKEDVRKLAETPEARVTYKGIHGVGLLRIYEESPPESEGARNFIEALRALFTGFTPNASLVTSRTLEDLSKPEFDESRRLMRERGESLLKQEHPELRYTWTSTDICLTDGRQLRIPPPMVQSPRGVLLHFQAIAGNPYEIKVLDEFRRRGWFVVDIDTYATVRSPVSEEDQRQIKELEPRRELAWKQLVGEDGQRRWTTKDVRYKEWEKLGAEIARLRAGSFQVCSDADLPRVAKEIAAGADASLVSNAIAAESVLDYLKSQRPDVPRGPIVLVGFSAGALAAPTAAARILDRLDAVVLIGGGANLLHLSQASSFTDGGLRVRCGKDKIPAARLRALEELYLNESKLDPYRTAPLLRNKKVLQVHGLFDGWVPAEGGELLYERLGRPDRLTITGGHQLLFYFLPSQAARIADWVDAAVAEAH